MGTKRKMSAELPPTVWPGGSRLARRVARPIRGPLSIAFFLQMPSRQKRRSHRRWKNQKKGRVVCAGRGVAANPMRVSVRSQWGEKDVHSSFARRAAPSSTHHRKQIRRPEKIVVFSIKTEGRKGPHQTNRDEKKKKMQQWTDRSVWPSEARGRKRRADVAVGPSTRDVAAGVCMALRRGEPVDPQAAQFVVSAARAEGAVGSDMDVLVAACSAGLASMALTPMAARSGIAPVGWTGPPAFGPPPSPTPPSPFSRQQQQQYSPPFTPAAGRKRRADEIAGATASPRSARDIAIDICRRTYRGEAVSPAEIETLREIAREEGSLGANLIRDVPRLCRAALVLMGESPATLTALAGGSMQGRRPTMPAAPPSSPVGPSHPSVVRLNLAPRHSRLF
ncbi:hypothetical protein psal_cds_1383 [Pandoravirus salinus]|uniref:Uncharacterized protein n=1 Tax=Pandoravirus salinus TaxID=1349410 RepID=A0A291ATT7_9VIRU|nr:hypothetical protein psal_cds_1383 [Pandoravirus salinus]ATE82312.1 hypothetical protein psal_cds_1383 [Pandoravirus salinus]